MWQKTIKKCDKYYKVWQEAITKCVRYYKVWQLLESETQQKTGAKTGFSRPFKFTNSNCQQRSRCWNNVDVNKLATKHFAIFKFLDIPPPANSLLGQNWHVSTRFREFINFQLSHKAQMSTKSLQFTSYDSWICIWYKSKISLANSFL